MILLSFFPCLILGFLNLEDCVQRTLRLLVGGRFQDLFHSPVRGTFHLSLTVLVRYRSWRVCSLRRRSSVALACAYAFFRPNFTCSIVLFPRKAGENSGYSMNISSTGLSPSLAGRSRRVRLYRLISALFKAGPSSLAATMGIAYRARLGQMTINT